MSKSVLWEALTFVMEDGITMIMQFMTKTNFGKERTITMNVKGALHNQETIPKATLIERMNQECHGMTLPSN